MTSNRHESQIFVLFFGWIYLVHLARSAIISYCFNGLDRWQPFFPARLVYTKCISKVKHEKMLLGWIDSNWAKMAWSKFQLLSTQTNWKYKGRKLNKLLWLEFLVGLIYHIVPPPWCSAVYLSNLKFQTLELANLGHFSGSHSLTFTVTSQNHNNTYYTSTYMNCYCSLWNKYFGIDF